MKHTLKLLVYAFIITLGLNELLPQTYKEVYMLFIARYGLMDSFKMNPQMLKNIKPFF